MAILNAVQLMGYLTRAPETKYTPKGTAIAETGIAVNRVWRGENGEKQEATTFVDLQFWGRTAEIAQQYLDKGSHVFVAGRIHLDTWENRQTGQKRSKLRVIVTDLQMLGTKPKESTSPQRPPPPQQQQRPTDPDLDAEPGDVPFRTTIYRDVQRSRLSRRIF
jgi:single-strand DNA-binding protein